MPVLAIEPTRDLAEFFFLNYITHTFFSLLIPFAWHRWRRVRVRTRVCVSIRSKDDSATRAPFSAGKP